MSTDKYSRMSFSALESEGKSRGIKARPEWTDTKPGREAMRETFRNDDARKNRENSSRMPTTQKRNRPLNSVQQQQPVKKSDPLIWIAVIGFVGALIGLCLVLFGAFSFFSSMEKKASTSAATELATQSVAVATEAVQQPVASAPTVQATPVAAPAVAEEAPVEQPKVVAPTPTEITQAPVSSSMTPLDLEFGTFTEGKWSTGQVDVKWVKTTVCDYVYRAWSGVKPNIFDTNPDLERRYYTPWVHLFCGTEGTSDAKLRLDRPTLYQIEATELRFVIVRDLAANGASNPSPYKTALGGDPNLKGKDKANYKAELALYIQGTGSIELADGTWKELKPDEFWQIPFPENLDRGIGFHFKGFKGELWQGSEELLEGKVHNQIDLPMVDLK